MEQSEINRVGPGVVLAMAVDLQSSKDIKIPDGVFIRHFDFSRSNDFQGAYEKCLYIPIHKGISDKDFDSFLSFIENNKNVLRMK
jgi:hypothetical protein